MTNNADDQAAALQAELDQLKAQKSEIKIKLAKAVSGFVAGSCASAVAVDVLRNNLAEPSGRYQTLKLRIGLAVVGGMVFQAADRYAERRVDDLVHSYREAKLQTKINAEES